MENVTHRTQTNNQDAQISILAIDTQTLIFSRWGTLQADGLPANVI
jgi:hypothetical protein